MRLLIIDDEEHAIKYLRHEIEGALESFECHSCNFNEAENSIQEIKPDAVVLDLLLKGNDAEVETPGVDTRDFIWAEHFCPIIVHSAEPGHHEESSEEHPFVRSIQKGRTSAGAVIKALIDFFPHMEALRKAKREIGIHVDKAFAQAMRDVAPQVFEVVDSDDLEKRAEAINRAGRRRLSAVLEGLSAEDVRSAWEMYLCPPASEQILLGDVLRQADAEVENGGPSENAEGNYFVVISPSCDLVRSATRRAKVSDVLVARCKSTKDAIGKTELQDLPRKEEKAKERLTRHLLNAGYSQGIVPLPGFRDVVPTMAADLRDLCLIPIEEIGADATYWRVASMNSPYRELVSWAYQQVACRPGLPVRDVEAWSSEVLADYLSADEG